MLTSNHGLFFTPSRGVKWVWAEDSATSDSSATFLQWPVEDLVGDMGAGRAGMEKLLEGKEASYVRLKNLGMRKTRAGTAALSF